MTTERAYTAREASYALAVVRVVVFGLCGWDLVSSGDPARLASLPGEWYVAPGFFRWLPDAFYETVFDPRLLVTLRWVAVGLAGAAMTGLRPYPFWAGAFCALYLLLKTLGAGFGGFIAHGWLGILFCSWILAVFPAADSLAFGRSRPRDRRVEPYAAPIVLMSGILCLCYFLLGTRRFARGGIEIFANDALPTYIGLNSLRHSAYGGFDLGLLILTSPVAAVAMKAGYLVVTVMEVLAPLCLFSSRFRWLWLAVMIPFHFSTLFTMNIFFDYNIILLLLLLTPLPFWLGQRLGAGEQLGVCSEVPCPLPTASSDSSSHPTR